MKQPAILILSDEADAYRRQLAELAAGGVEIAAFRDPGEAASAYAGQAVALGEPGPLAAALPSMPGVRWVQSTWAGVAPLLDAARAGLPVTGVKGVFGAQMAEFCLGYMLARELDIFERRERQRAREWYAVDTGRLAGKTLGVMGTGSIGAHIAASAAALGMRVVGFSRGGAPREPFEQVYPGTRLHEFLGGLDYLVAALPDTPDTDGLLDAAALAALPAQCWFINVGRGTLVDEPALAVALRDGRLAGAVLDVFRQEPLPPEHPFWDTPNLLLTAHIAAKSYPEDIARIFLDNYARFVAGDPLRYRVDPERGY